MRQTATFFAVSIASVLAAACLKGYAVKVSGDAFSPTFDIEQKMYCAPKQGTIRVSERGQTGSWDEIWSLDHSADSEASLAQFKYGEIPKGFSTMTPPRPLKTTHNYHVYVGCSGGVFASGLFRIEPAGETSILKNIEGEEARRLAP